MDYSMAQGVLPEVPDYNLFHKRDAGDDSLFVVFYMGATVDREASTQAGRLIARDEEYVRIVIPGDKNNVNDRPASEHDKQRFARQYAAFKAGMKEEEQLVGTRLKDWPAISRGQVLEMEYLGIKTVEQIAELRDDIVSRMPGARELKAIAQSWLGRAKSTAEAAQAVAKERALQNRITELEAAIKEQGTIISRLRDRETAKE